MVLIIPVKYESFLNISIWAIDETLLGITTPGQGGPGSNGCKGILLRSSDR